MTRTKAKRTGRKDRTSAELRSMLAKVCDDRNAEREKRKEAESLLGQEMCARADLRSVLLDRCEELRWRWRHPFRFLWLRLALRGSDGLRMLSAEDSRWSSLDWETKALIGAVSATLVSLIGVAIAVTR